MLEIDAQLQAIAFNQNPPSTQIYLGGNDESDKSVKVLVTKRMLFLISEHLLRHGIDPMHILCLYYIRFVVPHPVHFAV